MKGTLQFILLCIIAYAPAVNLYAQAPLKKHTQLESMPSFMVRDNAGNIYIAETHSIEKLTYSIEKFNSKMVSQGYASEKLDYKDIAIHNIVANGEQGVSLIGLYYDKKEDLTKILSIPLDNKTLLPGTPVTLMSEKGVFAFTHPEAYNIVGYGVSPDKSKCGYMILTPYENNEQSINIIIIDNEGQVVWQIKKKIDYDFPILSRFYLKISNSGDAAIVSYLHNPLLANKTSMGDQVMTFFFLNNGEQQTTFNLLSALSATVEKYAYKDLYLGDDHIAFCHIIASATKDREDYVLQLVAIDMESGEIINNYIYQPDDALPEQDQEIMSKYPPIVGQPLYYLTDSKKNTYCITAGTDEYLKANSYMPQYIWINITKFDEKMNFVWQKTNVSSDLDLYQEWMTGIYAFMKNDAVYLLFNTTDDPKQKALMKSLENLTELSVDGEGNMAKKVFAPNVKTTGYFVSTPLIMDNDNIYFLSRLNQAKPELYFVKMKI